MSDNVEEAKKDFYDGHEPEAREALKAALEAERGTDAGYAPKVESAKGVDVAAEDDEDEDVVEGHDPNRAVLYESAPKLSQE